MAARTTGKLNLVYFGSQEGELFNQFMSAAKTNDNYLFFHVSGVCAALHGQQHPGVSIFRSFDESPIHFSGSPSGLNEWMESSAVPTLIEFSEDYIEPIFGKGKDALILFTNDREANYNKVFADAASQLKGQILFVVSGTEQGIQQRLAEFVGVDASSAPTIRLLAPGEEMKKFVFSGSIQTLSVASLKAFIDDHKAGNLKPHLKSEPQPETQGPVTVVVGTTFDAIVMDTSKDVLVKYYAPWCGHCKSLAPVWEELGQHFADNNDLVIAKFDATANEVAGLSIRGYPTLRFYPKDNKGGIDYDGERDLDSFKKWLAEHSTAVAENNARKANDEL